MIEANEITPRLYMGSVPPVGSEVYKSGFSLLVLCALPDEYRHVYKIKSDQSIASLFPNTQVIIVSLNDNFLTKPSQEEKERILRSSSDVVNSIRNNRKVLITCMQGRNRSGLVAALAIRELCGWSGSQAKSRVRLKRKLEHGVALMNPQFVQILDELPAPLENNSPAKPKTSGLSLVRPLAALPGIQRRW